MTRLFGILTALALAGLLLGGCGTAVDWRCWSSADSRPCFCAATMNPCCENPPPPDNPSCKGAKR